MLRRDEESRLERIERQLVQIKAIVLILSGILIFGLFAPREWVERTGMWVLVLSVVGATGYACLKGVEMVLRWRLGDRESEMERRILREIRKEGEGEQYGGEEDESAAGVGVRR